MSIHHNTVRCTCTPCRGLACRKCYAPYYDHLNEVMKLKPVVRKEEPVSQHEWVEGRQLGFTLFSSLHNKEMCKHCGIIRNIQGSERPCRGKVKVTVRKTSATPVTTPQSVELPHVCWQYMNGRAWQTIPDDAVPWYKERGYALRRIAVVEYIGEAPSMIPWPFP